MKKIIILNFSMLVSIIFFMWSVNWQMAWDGFDPVVDLNATLCEWCVEEGFSYTEDAKCTIPMMLPDLTKPGSFTMGTIDIDCASVTPCISLWWEYYGGWQCCLWDNKLVIDGECRSCWTLSSWELAANPWRCSDDVTSCAPAKTYTEYWQQKCCPWVLVPSQENPWSQTCIVNNEWDVWINMNSECLINWQCSYNIYETLGIRKSDQDPTVWWFMQDIVLAVTTFIGTVVALVLVLSGILYIVASIRGSSNLADMAKKGIINSILWLLLVISSYAIVRLVQFLATAWGW